MLLRLAIPLLAGLVVVAAAPPLTVAHQHLTNMYGSVTSEVTKLEEAVGALQETTDRLVATAGDRDSILRLDRDAERTLRAADALSRKVDRFSALADQLAEAAR